MVAQSMQGLLETNELNVEIQFDRLRMFFRMLGRKLHLFHNMQNDDERCHADPSDENDYGQESGPHEDGPHEHEADENEADEHDPHEDGPDEHGSNGPGQHWEGPDQVQHDQVMPHLASLLTGLAGEAGHRIGDVLADRLTGDSADDSSHGHTASDVLADLIGNDAFVFNEVFGSPVFTDLLEKAGDFLDELAANVPPLQAALTELESGSGIIANILHELLPKDASPHALL